MLQNQKIVVIGASQGMGFATAQLLANQGNEVIIASRTKEKIEKAAIEIGGNTKAKVLDFTNEIAVKNFFGEVGNFDHLVLIGAGLPAWGTFTQFESEALKNAFDTKFFGYYYSAKHAIPHLRKDGSIVMVIGGAARKAIMGTSGVAAVNGAILAMGRTMTIELAPLRVNIVSPGLVDTPAYDWMNEEQKQDFFTQMGGQLPVGRVGQPEEVAHIIETVLDNNYLTGSVIDIDGGGNL
jgi:NAD(P)-dependent dehydrogenase (short-subunit alcohol dehydrogenase family)